MTEQTRKQAKKHHYVPKGLQKHFSENGRNIWFSEKTGDSYGHPKWRNIDTTFMSKYYYSILDGNGATSDKIEKGFYQVLDNDLSSILQEINDIFEQNQIPQFESEQLRSLRYLVWELMKRGPDFVKHDDVLLGKKATEDALNRLTAVQPDSQQAVKLRSRLYDQGKLRQHGRTIRVLAKLKTSDRVNEELENFTLRWAISRGRHSFLLSSAIVFRIGNSGSDGLINPNVELWFPISPKRAMVFLRDPESRIPHINEVSQTKMRDFNEYVARVSSQIASHSKALLESITGMNAKE